MGDARRREPRPIPQNLSCEESRRSRNPRGSARTTECTAFGSVETDTVCSLSTHAALNPYPAGQAVYQSLGTNPAVLAI